MTRSDIYIHSLYITCIVMTALNTSFEHVLHNLQERTRILNDAHPLIHDLLFSISKKTFTCDSFSRSLGVLLKNLESTYNDYHRTIERFEIGTISHISDYYSIIEQNSDQFDSKFLHIYSGHKEHYSPICTTNSKTTFSLAELVEIFVEHCYEFKKFKYHTDSSHLCRAREKTWTIYQRLSNYIASESIYDKSDCIIHQIDCIITSITTSSKQHIHKSLTDSELKTLNKIRSIIQQFNNIKLDFKLTEENMDICECGHSMSIISGSSEMVCGSCGYSYELKGTVFSDDQFYAQEGIRYKAAGYEPSKHCKSWLERIQARETNTITDTQIKKIETCIKRDGITNKKKITIEQLRRYLKDIGLTELNEHVALIKKMITGINPPQLTYSEIQDITNSFSKVVKAYNMIRPSNKSNIMFYPYCIFKLIEIHVSDYQKRKNLLSFIHLQGTQTLVQNDQIWASICSNISGLHYRPTDRYEYSS